MNVTKQSVCKKLSQDEPQHLATCHGQAAVAFVISNQPEPSLTLCVKADHLRKHAGEVSLPGGKLEHEDDSTAHAALRELCEETGLQLTMRQSVGFLRPIESLHRLSVIPCIFWSDKPLKGSPHEHEIAKVFTVPLDYFFEVPPTFDLSAHRSPAIWMPRWRYHEHEIWGLTALIVRDFFQTLLTDQTLWERSSKL